MERKDCTVVKYTHAAMPFCLQQIIHIHQECKTLIAPESDWRLLIRLPNFFFFSAYDSGGEAAYVETHQDSDNCRVAILNQSLYHQIRFKALHMALRGHWSHRHLFCTTQCHTKRVLGKWPRVLGCFLFLSCRQESQMRKGVLGQIHQWHITN